MGSIQLRTVIRSGVVALFSIATCTAAVFFSRTKQIYSQYEISVNAIKNIPYDVGANLFHFRFQSPGATGVACIDGRKITTFESQENVFLSSSLSAGQHRVTLRIEKPATLTLAETIHEEINLAN